MSVFLFCFAFFVGNAECEEKNANEKKQTPENNLPGAFPVKLQTPKSSQRIHRVLKKQSEASPFSKLYENLKKKLEAEKPLPKGAAEGEPGRVLPEPSAPVSSQSCGFDLSSLAERRETGRVEDCLHVRCDDGINPGFEQLAAGGGTPRRSFRRSPRAPISEEVSGESSQSPLWDPEGSRTPGRSKGTAATPKPRKESRRSSPSVLETCSIVSLDCPCRGQACSPTWIAPRGAEDEAVLNTPTPRRKSPRSPLVSPPRERPGMNPGAADAPRATRRGSVEQRSLPEVAAAALSPYPLCSIVRDDVIAPQNTLLKQRRSTKQEIGGKPLQEVLEEIWAQGKLRSFKVRLSKTCSCLSDSKSPRRKSRESKECLDKSAHSGALASEGMLASPAGQTPGRKRRRSRTSGVLAEAALEADTAQEHQNSGRKASGTPELAMDSCHHNQGLEDASAATPQRPSAKRRSGSAAELRDTEPASETKAFGLLHGEDSGKYFGSLPCFFIREIL